MKHSQKKSNKYVVKRAICDLQRQLHKASLTFLTETDVQCFLYHKLLMQRRLNRTMKIQLEGTDKFERITRCHAELKYTRRGRTSSNAKKVSYPDLIIFELNGIKIRGKQKKVGNYKPIVSPKKAVGIEIKLNRGHFHNTLLEKRTKKRVYFQKMISHDLKKLALFGVKFFIFVDQEGIFLNKRDKFDAEKLRRLIKKGKKKYSRINCAYLTPKFKKPEWV